MKKIILIVVLGFLALSCKERTKATSSEQRLPSKYQEGELVCVGSKEFIVYSERNELMDGQYRLQILDCRGEDCHYWVKESEIKKCD